MLDTFGSEFGKRMRDVDGRLVDSERIVLGKFMLGCGIVMKNWLDKPRLFIIFDCTSLGTLFGEIESLYTEIMPFVEVQHFVKLPKLV